MDLSINKIHHILVDAALPSTIEDLKNPNENYIVNLLTVFLSRFCIEVNLINQPLPEQHIVMTHYEDSNLINLINLHTVVTQIFDKIFLHDFCFTDITNPGQKRLKKHAKFLSNFVLYTMHKKPEYNDKNDQIEATSRLLEELKERNVQIVESINDKAKHKSNQSSMIKKLENDIHHISSQIEKINKSELQLEATKNELQKENQIAKEQCGSVKTAMGKLSKEIAELQSEIVYSPEEYQSRLDALKEQKKLKLEERDIMQEAIQEKKQSIKQIGEKLNFIPKMNDIFSTLIDTDKELISKKTKVNDIQKQIDSLNNTLNEWQTKLIMYKDQMDIEMNKLQLHREEDVVPLRNLCNQLLSEKKEQKTKFDSNQVYINKKYLKKNNLEADIKKKEEETAVLIYNWENIYNNEIANALIGLFQLVILLMLSGILFSVAAVSRLMEIMIILIYPTTVFLLRQSANLIILEIMLMDLSDKIPYLKYILRSEYIPYLITVAIMLMGWLLVSWIFHLIWKLLAPLTISAIILALIYPATCKWCFQQFGANLEEIINDFVHRFQTPQ